MFIYRPNPIALLIVFTLFAPSSLHAQNTPGKGRNNDHAKQERDRDYGDELAGGAGALVPGGGLAPLGPTTGSGTTATPATNAALLRALNTATAYCKLVQPKEYVIDCLAERLGEVSSKLQGYPEFKEVRAVLDMTSRKLNAIARQNRSATLAPASFSTKGQSPIKTTRILVPVDSAKLESAMGQARVVIDEAQTILLRSAEQSTDRSIQFQRIAAAVGSSKVLLRST